MNTLKEKFIWFFTHIIIKKADATRYLIIIAPCLIIFLFLFFAQVGAELLDCRCMAMKSGIEQLLNINFLPSGKEAHFGDFGSKGSTQFSPSLNPGSSDGHSTGNKIPDNAASSNPSKSEQPVYNLWRHVMGGVIGLIIGVIILLLISIFIQRLR